MTESPNATRGAKRFLLRGVLLVVGLGAGLAAGEFAVRLVQPQQLIIRRPDIWMTDPRVGWIHRPNVHTTLNTGAGSVTLVTDSLGRRIPRDGTSDSTDGPLRVLVLGDSFLEALQVEYEESLPALLEDRLEEELEEGVEVVNTAVGGWGPNHYLEQARLSFERRDYDVVLVFLFLGNDVVPERRSDIPPRPPTEVHHLEIPEDFSWASIIDDVIYPINDFLETRSHLFVFLKNRARRLRMKVGLTARYFPEVFLQSESDARRWDVTAEICRDIDQVARKHGASSLFVLIPHHTQVDTAGLLEYASGFGISLDSVDIRQPNRRLSAELRERHLTVVDLLAPLSRAAGTGDRLYGEADPHFTARGHRVSARAVTPIVSRLLRNRSPGSRPYTPVRPPDASTASDSVRR